MGSAAELDNIPPPGAWDSHVHVVDEETFPFDPQHPYRPAKATVADLQSFHREIGITHSCLVAVSVHGTDHRSILHALKVLGNESSPHRAVVTIDATKVSDEELSALHDAGVRGVRMNLHTRGDAVDRQAVQLVADRIRQMNWVLQLYIGLHQMAELADMLPQLRVTVVVDHLGEPDETKGPGRSQDGYAQLLQQLKQGSIYVKLSGTYRFAKLPDLDEYAVEILREAPDRVVWASDWPHTGGVKGNPGGDRTKVQPYRKVDDRAWVSRCAVWCNEATGGDKERAGPLAQKIWVDNPRRLWQAE
ncbi:amidohydrolase domain-containing protein [Sarocladium implicatum]|nr:amidohydrolase domain-containing protein [Sarocladium implicatum]